MIEFISQPWSWWVSGIMIAIVMASIAFLGNRFGISSSLRTICAIGGAGRKISLFNYDWKTEIWRLVFIAGSIIGGFIATQFLSHPEGIALSAETLQDLNELGVSTNTQTLVPVDLFSWESLLELKGWILMVVGGFLIGFGTRYAGGCTSGHAISGLSELQVPSLIAVVGFFIGGLIATHLLLPFILTL